MGEVHWGMPLPATTLCGGIGAHCTTVRKVTCRYCLNRIDRFISDNHEAFLAANAPGLNTSGQPFDFTGVCDVCGELVAGEGERHKECNTSGQEGGR